MKKVLLAAAALAALVTAAVASAAARPTVVFVAPKQGATTGSTVTFQVRLSHFTLDPAAVGKRAKAGFGHLHFQMDGGKFDFPKYSGANGKLAVTLGIQGKYSPSVTPTIRYSHLPKGKHTLVVFLANNDHSPVGAKASVSFTVR